MIKTLLVENFQSHKKTELNFHPGVNIIVGDSDSGKSAIIRALRWGIYSQPTGDSFRSWWGGDTKVTIQMMEDESFITRRKGNNSNEYILNDGEPFTAFRNNVPVEISQVFNMSQVNIQGQLDSHFLLSNSPGEVANFFNKIANIDNINLSIKELQSKADTLNKEIAYSEQSITKNTLALKAYEFLDKFEMEVEVLESMEELQIQIYAKVTKLNSIIETMQTIQIAIDKKTWVFVLEENMNGALLMIDSQKKVLSDITKLSFVIDSIDYHEFLIKKFQTFLNFENTVIEILALQKELEIQQKRNQSLIEIIQNIGTYVGKIGALKVVLAKLEKEFQDNFPEACPLCGEAHSHDTH